MSTIGLSRLFALAAGVAATMGASSTWSSTASLNYRPSSGADFNLAPSSGRWRGGGRTEPRNAFAKAKRVRKIARASRRYNLRHGA